jgi:hypothetical protein
VRFRRAALREITFDVLADLAGAQEHVIGVDVDHRRGVVTLVVTGPAVPTAYQGSVPYLLSRTDLGDGDGDGHTYVVTSYPFVPGRDDLPVPMDPDEGGRRGD